MTAVKYDNKSNIEIVHATRVCVCGAYADEPKLEKPSSFAAGRRRKQEKMRERTMQLAQRGRSKSGADKEERR